MSVSGSSATLRRVSFQESAPTPPLAPIRRRCVGLSRSRTSVVAAKAAAVTSPILKTAVTVLHGRVVKEALDGNNSGSFDQTSHCHESASGSIPSTPTRIRSAPHSIRDSMERKSTFCQLTEETVQFQKQIAALELAVKEYSEMSTVERAWRVRVLLKTAQDLDQSLWTKLYEFEKTLLSHDVTMATESTPTTPMQTDELRQAQTACMKLHRDFKYSHKALLMCLSLVESHQQIKNSSAAAPSTGAAADAAASGSLNPLGNTVGWTGGARMFPTADIDQDDSMNRNRLTRQSASVEYHGNAAVVVVSDFGHSTNGGAAVASVGADGQVSLSSQRSPDVVYTSFREVNQEGVRQTASVGAGTTSRLAAAATGTAANSQSRSKQARRMALPRSGTVGSSSNSNKRHFVRSRRRRTSGMAGQTRYDDQDEEEHYHADNDFFDYDFDDDETQRGLFCGGYGYDGTEEDDSSVREANVYDRLYRAVTREFWYVKRDLAKVGMNLGCGTSASTSSDVVSSSSRFPSVRQTST